MKYLFFALTLLNSCCTPKKNTEQEFLTTEEKNERNQLLLLGNTLKTTLESTHLMRPKLKNLKPAEFFDRYLEKIDANKTLLTEKDLGQLKEIGKDFLDQLLMGNLKLVALTKSILEQRYNQMSAFVENFLNNPIQEENSFKFEIDSKKRSYPRSQKELEELWKGQLLMDYYSKKFDLEEEQKKNKIVDKTSLEKKVIERMKITWNKYIERQRKKLSPKKTGEITGLMSKFYNAILEYDPHTNYLPPQDNENFAQSMRGEFEGIGAMLQEKNNYIYVEEIVPGGPAAKNGKLMKGDKILKIKQTDGTEVDAFALSIFEAVEVIKGKKGTKVQLTLQRANGEIYSVTLTRDILQIEDSLVRSSVLEKSGEKIGYIILPKFYRDLSSFSGKNCSDDLKADLLRLKQEGIKGLILDVRNNTGGSLEDAMKISQFFVGKKPVVQIQDHKGEVIVPRPQVQEGPFYDGPMIVLTNYLSASASEILAAALQDYSRALIVGGPETHGKGTVQSFLDLSDRLLKMFFGENHPARGAVKITTQKFYRVSGETTQFNGVIPDIILPDIFMIEEFGERFSKNAVPPSRIKSLSYTSFNQISNKKELQAQSAIRVKDQKNFKRIQEILTWYKDQKKNTLRTLSYNQYKKEILERKKFSFEQEEEKDEVIDFLKELKIKFVTPFKQKDKKTLLEDEKKIRRDAYLEEALYLMKELTKNSQVNLEKAA